MTWFCGSVSMQSSSGLSHSGGFKGMGGW